MDRQESTELTTCSPRTIPLHFLYGLPKKQLKIGASELTPKLRELRICPGLDNCSAEHRYNHRQTTQIENAKQSKLGLKNLRRQIQNDCQLSQIFEPILYFSSSSIPWIVRVLPFIEPATSEHKIPSIVHKLSTDQGLGQKCICHIPQRSYQHSRFAATQLYY